MMLGGVMDLILGGIIIAGLPGTLAWGLGPPGRHRPRLPAACSLIAMAAGGAASELRKRPPQGARTASVLPRIAQIIHEAVRR